MIGFDAADPPEDYKEFKKSILQTIEETEVEEDENYPGALFLVDREDNADIIHIDDIVEQYEDEDISLEEVIFELFPDIIRKNNSKYFAFVFSGEKALKKEREKEIVAVLSGDLFHTDMVLSEVDRNYEYAELGPWEKEDFMSYITLVSVFRQAITYQG